MKPSFLILMKQSRETLLVSSFLIALKRIPFYHIYHIGP